MLLLLHVSLWPRADLRESGFAEVKATHTCNAGILEGVEGHLEQLSLTTKQKLQVLLLEGKLEASLSQPGPLLC